MGHAQVACRGAPEVMEGSQFPEVLKDSLQKNAHPVADNGGKVPPYEFAGHVFPEEQSGIAVVEIGGTIAPLLYRGAHHVIAHRLGHIQGLVTGQLGPEGQVHILEGGEEDLVEEPDVIEHGLSVHGGAGIDAEDELFFIILSEVIFAGPHDFNMSVEVDPDRQHVDPLALMIAHQLGARGARIWMTLEGGEKFLHLPRVKLNIVIEKAYIFSAGGLDAPVHGIGKAIIAV